MSRADFRVCAEGALIEDPALPSMRNPRRSRNTAPVIVICAVTPAIPAMRLELARNGNVRRLARMVRREGVPAVNGRSKGNGFDERLNE